MRHSLLKYKSINLNNIDTIDDDYDNDDDMNQNNKENKNDNNNVGDDNDISTYIISNHDFAYDDIESSTSDRFILTSNKLTSAKTNGNSNRRIQSTNNKYINKKKVISSNNNNKLNWLSNLCLQYNGYFNCINLYLLLYLLLFIIIIILIIIIYSSNQYNYHQIYHDLSIYQQHSSHNNTSNCNNVQCGDNRISTGIDKYSIISGDKNDMFYILVDKQQQQHQQHQQQQQQQVSSSRSLYCYLSSSLFNQEEEGIGIVSMPILMVEQLTTGLGK
jgi:hypothetical protein